MFYLVHLSCNWDVMMILATVLSSGGLNMKGNKFFTYLMIFALVIQLLPTQLINVLAESSDTQATTTITESQSTSEGSESSAESLSESSSQTISSTTDDDSTSQTSSVDTTESGLTESQTSTTESQSSEVSEQETSASESESDSSSMTTTSTTEEENVTTQPGLNLLTDTPPLISNNTLKLIEMSVPGDLDTTNGVTETDPVWDYLNYTGNFLYAFVIEKDTVNTTPEGEYRIVTVDIDAFDVGDALPFRIESYGRVVGNGVNSITLSEDETQLVFELINDEIPDTGINASFTIGYTNYYKPTTYHQSAGTPAVAIGNMLLQSPNARIGFSITDSLDSSSNILVEHVLKRDNHGEHSLFESVTISDSQGLDYSGKLASYDESMDVETPTFYLGSDARLDYGNPGEIGTDYTSFFFLYEFSNEIHAPLNNIQYSFNLPSEFRISSSSVSQSDAKVKSYATFKYDGAKGSSSIATGSGLSTGQTFSISSYNSQETSLTKDKMDSLVGSVPYPDQYFSAQIVNNYPTTSSSYYGVYSYASLDDLAPGEYDSDPIVVTYDQVVLQEDGTYKVETQTYDYGTMRIVVPEYQFQDRTTLTMYEPLKVNYIDEDSTRYGFRVNIDVSTSDIQNDIAALSYQDEIVSIEIPEFFDPFTFELQNYEDEFTAYKVYYENNESSEWISTNGNKTVIDLKDKDGSPVTKFELQISDRGLMEASIGSGYDSSFYFTGKFSKPTDGDNWIETSFDIIDADTLSTIKDDLEIKWEYMDGVDNMFVNVEYYGYNADQNYLLSEFDGAFTPYELEVEVDTYTDTKKGVEERDSSRIYRNVTLDIDGSEQMFNQLSGYFNFSGNTQRVTFYGDTWLEYTTNLNDEYRKVMIYGSAFNQKIPLLEGEYITDVNLRVDGIRMISGTTDVEILALKYSKHRDTPSGDRILPRETATVTFSAEGELINDVLEGEFDDPTSEKLTDSTPLYFRYEVDLDLYHEGRNDIEYGEASISRNNVLYGETLVHLPIAMEDYVYSDDPGFVYYPEGSKVYLEMNSQYFSYVGYDERVSIETLGTGNKTYLVYDLAGIPVDIKGSSSVEQTILNFPVGTFLANQSVKENEEHSIFLNGYVDIGPLANISSENAPYVSLNKNGTYSSYNYIGKHTVDDVEQITKGSGNEDFSDRLVPLDVDKKLTVVALVADTITIYTGKDITGESTKIFNGTDYVAYEYSNLVISTEIQTRAYEYRDYHLVLQLPTQDETLELAEVEYTSANSVYLRNLVDSVKVEGDFAELNYEVSYYSDFTFDTNLGEIDYVGTEITDEVDLTKAKYVLIKIDYVPVDSTLSVELKVNAVESDMYSLAHEKVAYTSAFSRYKTAEEDASGVEKVQLQEATSSNLGKFIFNWYELEGIIFKEHLTEEPNGVYNQTNEEYVSMSTGADLYFKDIESSNASEHTVILGEYESSVTGKYTALIQPKGSVGTRVPYEVIFDLEKMGLWTDYRITSSGHEEENKAINNNYPRINNANTVGVEFYADTVGFENTVDEVASPDAQITATDEEFLLGQVDIGLYQNPKLISSASDVMTYVGEELEFSMTLNGTGSIKTDQVDELYKLEDEDTYADRTVAVDDTNDKQFNVVLKGNKHTFQGYSFAQKDATTPAVNWFGEDVELTTTYRVNDLAKVTFHQSEYDSNTSDAIDPIQGEWVDSDHLETVDVELKVTSVTSTSAPLVLSQVPEIIAPEGYVFDGWRRRTESGSLYSTKYYTFSESTNFTRNDHFYPVFLEDKVGAIDPDTKEEIGDGIPDVYQVRIEYTISDGGEATLERTGEIINDPTNMIYFYAMRLTTSNPQPSEAYPDPTLNPAYWASSYGYVKLKSEDIAQITQLDKYHSFEYYYRTYGTSTSKYYEYDVDGVMADNHYGSHKVIKYHIEIVAEEMTITFEKSEGQASKYTEEVVKVKGDEITDTELEDSKDEKRSEAAYGYDFKEWQDVTDPTNPVVVATSDEELKEVIFEEDTTLKPIFTKEQFKVSFEVNSPISDENVTEDAFGNSISGKNEVTVDYQTEIGSADSTIVVPTVTKTTNPVYANLYEFSHWEYTMDSATGVVTGQVSDLNGIEITGNVVFKAVFVPLPSIAIAQHGNATVASKKFTTADGVTSFTSSNVSSLTFDATAPVIDFKVKPADGLHDGVVAYKADANYDVSKIEVHYLPLNGKEVVTSVIYVKDGVLDEAEITKIETATNSTINVDLINEYITVDDIGGSIGEATMIVFHVYTQLEKRTVTFEVEDTTEGLVDKENPDFTVSNTQEEATLEVEYGTDGLEFPTVTEKPGYVFDKWVDESNKEISEDDLLNLEITEDLTFKAHFEEDKIGTDGVSDGIADKYQTTFIFVSSDEDKITVDAENEVVTSDDKKSDVSMKGEDINVDVVDKGHDSFTGWKFYTIDETTKEKVYLQEAGEDILVSQSDALKYMEFEMGQTIYVEAQVETTHFVTSFNVDEEHGSITHPESYEQVLEYDESVLLNTAVESTPHVEVENDMVFVGWYETRDDEKKIVDPTTIPSTGTDLSYTGKFLPKEQASVNEDLVITGNGFTISNDEKATLTVDDIVKNSGSEAWNVVTGEILEPTISEEDLKKIQDVGPDGGIVSVTLTAKDTDGKEVEREILIVVEGTTTDSNEDDAVESETTLGLEADGFILDHSQAGNYDPQEAITNGNANGYVIETSKELVVTPNQEDIDNIKNAPSTGGIYDQRYTITEDGKTVEVTVKVIVEGEDVASKTYDEAGLSLSIVAKDFTIENAEAASLDEELAKLTSEVDAAVKETSEEITNITANPDQLKKIQNAGPDGGVFDLTYTATYVTKTGETYTVEITVKVTVKALPKPPVVVSPGNGDDAGTTTSRPQPSQQVTTAQTTTTVTSESSTTQVTKETATQPEGSIEEGKITIPNLLPEETLKKVEFEGDELDDSMYTVEEDGSITLNPDVLKGLPDGEYVLRVTYGDTTFTTVILVQNEIPMSMGDFTRGNAWSLFDLVMTIIVGVFMVLYFTKRKKVLENAIDEEEAEIMNRDEQKEKTDIKRLRTYRILGIIMFIVILVFLLITQDFRQPMTIFDRYSLYFGLIALLGLFVIITFYNGNDEEDEDEMQESYN